MQTKYIQKICKRTPEKHTKIHSNMLQEIANMKSTNKYFCEKCKSRTHEKKTDQNSPQKMKLITIFCFGWSRPWHCIWHSLAVHYLKIYTLFGNVWASVLEFWLAFDLTWPIFWRFIWHSFWRTFWRPIWRVFWHVCWHSAWHIFSFLPAMLSGIFLGIKGFGLSLAFQLASFWHVF